jgi:MYXO-CTERM domain-containing protein
MCGCVTEEAGGSSSLLWYLLAALLVTMPICELVSLKV